MGKVLYILAWCLSHMSPRGLGSLATGLTWLLFDVLHIRRTLVLKNLAIAYPGISDGERLKVGRTSVRHFVLTALEFLHSFRGDIASQVTMIGLENLTQALAQGRGAYILCCHLGNWEAMGAAMSRRIVPSHVLVKKVGSPSVHAFVSRMRERNGFHWVKREKKGDGFKAIEAILGRGEIVGFVMDQARPGEPKLPFFGRPAKTNTSFAAIWRRLPAPIIPAFIVRDAVGVHTLTFLPEVKPVTTEDTAADVLRHSTEFNAVVEEMVRRHPEHYFWMHNRWK